MPVRMTARHCELTSDDKRQVETRSRQFERFFDNIIDLHWVLEVDKHRHVAETSAKVHGTVLTGRGEATDMRSAIDEAAGRMEAQLKKYKDRLKSKDARAIAGAKGTVSRPETVSSDEEY
ncbi:MAG: ribosome-associated translation inhibitor RaiA [Candidatus Zixiibacteriota bacterium]